MRICIINVVYYPQLIGGAEISVQKLTEQLVKRGHEVFVISMSRTPQVGLWHNGVEIFQLSNRNVYWPFDGDSRWALTHAAWHLIDILNPLSLNDFRRVFKQLRPDLVNTHNLVGFSLAPWFAAQGEGIPVVHSLHDYYMCCPRSTMTRSGMICEEQCLECKAFRLPHISASRSISGVVSVSRYTLDQHIRAGLFEGISRAVIPNSVAPVLKESPTPMQAATSPMRIGYMGRISREKGIEVLIKALELLPSEEFSLEIAGKGEPDYFKQVESQGRGRVIFRGFIETRTFLGNLDVLVVPSTWGEPFGRVVIEAFSAGVVVVASAVGGMTELIIDNQTGILVPPGDPAAIACALRYLRHNESLMERIRHEAGKELPKYSIERHVDSYENMFENAIGTRQQATQR